MEIGHSTLKRASAIALVDAAWEDTCTMILQEQEHSAFLAGRKYSMGKGPGAGAVAEKLKKQQMKRAKEYQKAFQEQNFDLDDTDGMFIPQKKAKHRHPELADFGVEGTTQETESPTPGTSMAAEGRSMDSTGPSMDARRTMDVRRTWMQQEEAWVLKTVQFQMNKKL